MRFTCHKLDTGRERPKRSNNNRSPTEKFETILGQACHHGLSLGLFSKHELDYCHALKSLVKLPFLKNYPIKQTNNSSSHKYSPPHSE